MPVIYACTKYAGQGQAETSFGIDEPRMMGDGGLIMHFILLV